MIDKEQISSAFQNLQDRICNKLETLDGTGKFEQDLWEREGGGGGRTRIIKGKHIEKGGVNFSAVHGLLDMKIASSLSLPNRNFYATGVSIVLHPKNPWVPIIHMNVRYFESGNKWWFGGGIDVTPHYVIKEDAQFFHQSLKEVCNTYTPTAYAEFKEWADNYFYIRHRAETRGIGGIFFDQLNADKGSKEELSNFVMKVGESFIPIYTELFSRNYQKEYSKENQAWQSYRRGRYVEFNLVWDRGTKFGLETNGRTESILMSLPPIAQWAYNLKVEEGSLEKATQEALKKNIDWIS